MDKYQLAAESVKAIREDKLVGRGTCSQIDECMEDREIVDLILTRTTEDGDVQVCTDPRLAVKLARDSEQHYLERALDCEAEWARDAYRNFKAERKNDRI